MNKRDDKNLYALHVAVEKNTCRPKQKEAKEITVKRKILASPSMEGDSQIGMILFVGVAHEMGYNKLAIKNYLSIEFDGEFDYKLRKYKAKLDDAKDDKVSRFRNKVILIKNHLRFNNVGFF